MNKEELINEIKRIRKKLVATSKTLIQFERELGTVYLDLSKVIKENK